MKLHVTMTSPYARMARAAVLEHNLQDRVEVCRARTRETNSPYYAITPSGRVPYLGLDDGRGIEDSQLICAYFDAIGNGPPLAWDYHSPTWEYTRLLGLARSTMEGISVLAREIRRPEEDRSASILAHEKARNTRQTDLWETLVDHPLMQGRINMVQLIIYCGFDALTLYTLADSTPERPALQAWRKELSKRPSLAATVPPAP
ncbi:MAG: glutathione S-transferase family protein [Hyphomicrobiaceae bacterium]